MDKHIEFTLDRSTGNLVMCIAEAVMDILAFVLVRKH